MIDYSRFAKPVKPVVRAVLNSRAKSVAAGLCRTGDATERLVGTVLLETLQDRNSPDERAWIERIESLRTELGASAAQVDVVDYGAGKANLNLSEACMQSGREARLTVADICATASKPYFWALLLFRLIRTFRPTRCLELGTCLGISAAYQAAALKLNGRGSLVTMEGAPALAAIATEHFDRFGLDNVNVVVGRFQDTLERVLADSGPLDYAFIDGHHTEAATLDYFRRITPFLAPQAVLVFDDISWSPGMKSAWRTIAADPGIRFSADLRQIGVCVVAGGDGQRGNISLPLV